MRKTSVYLTEGEAESLRLAAAASGKAQAELIRQGVRHVIAEAEERPRIFHSLGKGRGGGQPFAHWEPDELYRKVMGRG